MNITNYVLEGSRMTTDSCMEWCSGQLLNAAYGEFLILLLFNAVLTGVYLILFKCSDNLVHNTKLTEDRLVIILNSLIKLVFLVNAAFGIYWMLVN